MTFDEENPVDYVKWGVAIILIVLILGVVGVGAKILFFPSAVAGKLIDADKAIGDYEWFEAQYAEIKATESKIKGFYATHDLETLSSVDKTNIDGMTQYLESVVGQYNGKSTMKTRTLWKSPTLPYKLKVEYTSSTAAKPQILVIEDGK